jgi:hypothetical protein
MTFGSTFGRVFSPTFQPKSQAAGGGWWDLNGTITSCVAAYQPKGAASYAASKVNLANPGTYNAADGAAYPTWAAETGWTFNATNSQYLATGIPIVSGMTIIHRYYNLSGDGYITTNAVNDVRYTMLPWMKAAGGTKAAAGYGTSGLLALGDGTSSTEGVLALNNLGLFLNGTRIRDLSAASWSGTSTDTFPIGCRTTLGTLSSFATGNVYAIAFYSGTLTAEQIASLTTAMNAL